MRRIVCIGAIAAIAAAACSGSKDSGTTPTGVVQLTSVAMNPANISCGGSPSSPPTENASPDTVAVQLTIINTTSHTDTVVSAGTYATVIRSSASADVGTVITNIPSLPFIPAGAVVPARTGATVVRVSYPAQAACLSKPVFYVGNADINVAVRITTTSGQYETIPATIHIVWSAL